jgi:class 3 adenylate cyclase
MAWKKATARERILRYAETIPMAKIERFEDELIPRRQEEKAIRRALGASVDDTPALYNLPDGAAVVVEGAVHVYVRALSYDDVRLQDGHETEYSHARALAYLSLLYGAADRAVAAVGAQRVDFHGGRMHAVIAEPAGAANLALRVSRAIALARALTEIAREAAGMFARQQQYPFRFRIGMDLGTCVALNSGRSDDHEPVFIGPPANHAAKLAAGDEEGVYMSDNVRRAMGFPLVGQFDSRVRISEQDVLFALRLDAMYNAQAAAGQLERWDRDVRAKSAFVLSPEAFQFREFIPPLSGLKYEDLSPSRSIRMGLVSLFADLDGYTRYIDACVASDCLGTAVRLLHIVRSELNDVVKIDFKGRKVRFIGDCIHAVMAAGNHRADPVESVEVSAQCAGGLRSSFELCQELVEHADRLGLAIGFEYGMTPISRIGIRGDRAVRVASSLATRASERLQQDCNGRQTQIGPRAYDLAPVGIKKLFGVSRIADRLLADHVLVGGTPVRTAALVGGAAAVLSSTPAAAAASRAFSR